MSESNFTADELKNLQAFRRAAREIFESSFIQSGGDIGVSFKARVGGETTITSRGPDEERFRSFMIALRKTYAESDGANFLKNRNAIARRREGLRERLGELKKGYLATLKSQEVKLFGMGHERLFEAWLYGSVFHDDDDELRAAWESVAGSPMAPVARTVVQATALWLAQHVLALDEIVADVLGEEPLPDIAEHDDSSTAPEADVRIAVRRRGADGSQIVDITNGGPANAENLEIGDWVALNEGDPEVYYPDEWARKFPRPMLRPDETVSFKTDTSMESATEFEVTLVWDDPSAKRRREVFQLDLHSV